MAEQGLVDLRVFGRRLRSARILAGFDTVAEATSSVRTRTGVAISDRTFYAIERGEQMPNLEQFMAVTITFRPPYMWRYWTPALNSLVQDNMVADTDELEIQDGLSAEGRPARRPRPDAPGKREA